MSLKTYFLFSMFTLLFLFYPGESVYFRTFADHPEVFEQKEPEVLLKKNELPTVKQIPPPELSAEGVYVVDLPSFTPVFERNSQGRFLPASTTKVITALVAYENADPDDVVTVTRVMGEGQTMGLVVGEKITVENLLYGILVHSGNDAAYALADHFGYDNFIEKMNKKAQELRMEHTQFKNPAGLDDFQQYTSPYDLAVAARELLKHKALSKIASTRDITISDSEFINFHRLINVNRLLGEVHGIGGLKTGYTENAGENLVSFYKHNDHQFIIVILKSKDRFEDTKNMVRWIDEAVQFTSL